MMKLELKLEQPSRNRAARSAGTIALSYLIGGFIPLLPYILSSNSRTGFYFSCGFTILALLIFGYFKSSMTGQPVVKGTLKMTLTGIIAAGCAYFLAKAVT